MVFHHGGGFGAPNKPHGSTPSRSGEGSACHRQRSLKSSQDSGSDSEWNAPLVRPEKQRRFRTNPSSSARPASTSLTLPFSSVGRAVAFAAFCSSVVAVVISLFAVWFFYSSAVLDLYSDQQLITTTSVVRTRFRVPPRLPATTSTSSASVEHEPDQNVFVRHQRRSQPKIPSMPILLSHLAEEIVPYPKHESRQGHETFSRRSKFWLPTTTLNSTTSKHVHRSRAHDKSMRFHGALANEDDEVNDDGIRPHVAWLMSFPNSGTSFTIHMTREASNCTTATNYALEGEIRDKPSVAAVPGEAGRQGPWLELIPYRHTTVPKRLVLTKTHCKGFCTGPKCGPDKMILTVRSFMMGCLTGTRAVETRRGLVTKDVTYSPALVKKAIHLFRHPLDNIVARFHLEYNAQELVGNRRYARKYPKNATGFKSWCAAEDKSRDLLRSPLLDKRLTRQLARIPCFNDFFRYLQWHNLAFSLAHEMNLPTMVLHYHEYAENYEKARDQVLAFLELPRTGDGIPFEVGKVYRDYYSNHQKKAIRNFLKEFSSSETWEQLEMYDFEFDE